MNPIKFQQDAVEKLIETFKSLWETGKSGLTITFKSPTGSGKTFMVSRFLNDLLRQPDWHEDAAYVWITFSDDLAMQSKDKFYDYFFPNLSHQLLTIADFDQGILNPNDILFLNWQKLVSKKAENRLLRRPDDERKLKEQGFYFEDVAERTRAAGREIVMIIDESHKNVTTAAIRDVINPLNPKIILKISATPEEEPSASDVTNYRAGFVEVNRQQVVDAGLIKQEILCQTEEDLNKNPGRDNDLLLLDLAREKREALVELWNRAGQKVNPLVLIQLPNDEKALADSGVETKETVVRRFLSDNDVPEERIACWFDNRKENLEWIADPDCPVDYLLFKQAAGTGWDCPRAHVLVMYREINSPTFHTQTLGRILRMAVIDPDAKLPAALRTGYLYTNYSRNQVGLPEPGPKNKPKVYTSRLTPQHRTKLAVKQLNLDLSQTLEAALPTVPVATLAETVKRICSLVINPTQVLFSDETTGLNLRFEDELPADSTCCDAVKQILTDGQPGISEQSVETVTTQVRDYENVIADRQDGELVLDPELISDFLPRAEYGDLGKASQFQDSFIRSMNQFFKIVPDQLSLNLNEQTEPLSRQGIDTTPVLEQSIIVNARFKTDAFPDKDDEGTDVQYEMSSNDVEQEFSWLCYKILTEQTDPNAKVGNVARSWGILKEGLRQWFGKYALPGYSGLDYYKVFIKNVEKADSILKRAITQALKDYRPILEAYQQTRRERETQQFSVPFTIKTSYSYTEDAKEYPNAQLSLVQPFRLPEHYNGRENEIQFIAFLEEQKNLDWWFKNGDLGKDYLAFRYSDTQANKERLFYPDWILKYKDGTIGIFDTKGGITADSLETRDKAEELQRRLRKLNRPQQAYCGGIAVRSNGQWVYNNSEQYRSPRESPNDWKPLA